MVLTKHTSKNPDASSIKTPQELVHIKHKITLRQYKYWVLILKTYREAYEGNIAPSDGGFYYMPMNRLTEYLGYEPVKAEMRADFEALRKEAIIYNVLSKDGRKSQRGSGFISEWELSSNWIGYKLPDFLVKCIERLDLKNAIFQQINWNIFNSFSGKYEAILYKLCKDYVGVLRTPYMLISNFRDYMGLKESEYAAFKDLNKFVISGPIKKINDSKLADIEIEVIFTKESRRVVGLQFLIGRKQQMDLGFGDDPAFSAARITISLAQQHKYLAEKDPAEIALAIERANAYADDQELKGNQVNLGAIYQTAILQGWGAEHKAKLELEAKKMEKKLLAEKAKQAQLDQNEENALIKDEKRKEARRRFELLDSSEQTKLVEQFGQTLRGFPLTIFQKTGIKNRMLEPTFFVWLTEHFQLMEPKPENRV